MKRMFIIVERAGLGWARGGPGDEDEGGLRIVIRRRYDILGRSVTVTQAKASSASRSSSLIGARKRGEGVDTGREGGGTGGEGREGEEGGRYWRGRRERREKRERRGRMGRRGDADREGREDQEEGLACRPFMLRCFFFSLM